MLFGHQNDNNKPAQDGTPDGTNPLAVDPETGASLPVAPEDLEHDNSPEESVLNQTSDEAAPAEPTPTLGSDTQTTDAPASDTPVLAVDAVKDDGSSNPPAPVVDTASDSSVSAPTVPTSDDTSTTPAGDDELLSLKQQALQQLSPLVSHLDQTPEEKFRTTMMMLQSTDNQALIKDAYEAAQQIEDDKARAQALLDIINEINYFTQNDKDS